MKSKGLPVYGKRQVKYEGQTTDMFYSPLGINKDGLSKTDEGSLMVPGLASAGTIDRTQEVVAPESFAKHLDVYKRNPLVTFQHDIFYPVGKAVDISIVEGGLAVVDQLLYLPTDGLINYLYAAIEQGVLRTMSIGFIPLKWEDDATTQIRTYTEVMLVEHAIVSYPANMDAEITTGDVHRSLGDLEDDETKLAKMAYATGMLASSIKAGGGKLSKGNIESVEQVMSMLKTARNNLSELVTTEKTEEPPAESELDFEELDNVVNELKGIIEGDE